MVAVNVSPCENEKIECKDNFNEHTEKDDNENKNENMIDGENKKILKKQLRKKYRK